MVALTFVSATATSRQAPSSGYDTLSNLWCMKDTIKLRQATTTEHTLALWGISPRKLLGRRIASGAPRLQRQGDRGTP